ncbi:MAG: hypothetical protein QF408_14140, partial [Pirellulales bacterium]|nr:hypothetical protein [Pirellulales bacterium]
MLPRSAKISTHTHRKDTDSSKCCSHSVSAFRRGKVNKINQVYATLYGRFENLTHRFSTAAFEMLSTEAYLADQAGLMELCRGVSRVPLYQPQPRNA